ncbi:transmembrane emp24 domain-containing protein, putative [Plasmodium malariae]|uniref:Transmembrane emp24 domain-containing protein, putative n=1 Tax=Plasmodium malariae TaxID=5858 RepID=A0A1D3RHK2_PLAMA|nr:transmembrane emp24 domain-containing protein, putative [Plasmodium malariae]SCN44651.1 transmembrane emp24 domain-containing protein, putative [Plasmodium malariae]
MKGVKGSIFVLFLLLFICFPVQAAYFFVKEGVEKCFVESVVSNVVITATYDNYGLKELKCLINFKDREGRVLNSHEASQVSKGKVSFLTKKNGLYYICISCPASNWFKSTSIKWSLSIDVGGSDIDLQNVAKKSELSETLNILLNLKKRFSSMKLEQTYQKQMATNLYEHNQAVHNQMFYFYIIEIVILVAITIYSIMHLKQYFKAQKLM